MPASAPPSVMPAIATLLPVPAFLLPKAPLALATLKTSLPRMPAKLAFPVVNVAAVVASYTRLAAVMPLTALIVAGVMSAAVLAVLLASV